MDCDYSQCPDCEGVDFVEAMVRCDEHNDLICRECYRKSHAAHNEGEE
jgi:hypothetical protein